MVVATRKAVCINHCLKCAIYVYMQVCGVKGSTVLALRPAFNPVWGVVIDDLHSIFLGVTLTLLHLWIDKTHKDKPFFIGKKVSICRAELCDIMYKLETYYTCLQGFRLRVGGYYCIIRDRPQGV